MDGLLYQGSLPAGPHLLPKSITPHFATRAISELFCDPTKQPLNASQKRIKEQGCPQS